LSSNDERFPERQRFLGQAAESCVAADWFAYFYREQGRYSESVKLSNLNVETRKTELRQENPYTLASMNNLALTYRNQGRWLEAEKLGL
jgi:Tetratricopeptide repeat